MGIFSAVRYALSSSNESRLLRDISNLLNANGAVEVPFEQATHVITSSLEFESNSRTPETCVLVTPRWIERSQVLGKMLDPQYFSPDPAMLFSGVHATTTGLLPHDIDLLKSLITSLGGQYSDTYTRATTHLITTTTDSAKYKAAITHKEQTGIKVVLPGWVTDSSSAQQRMPEDPYEFPEPDVLSNAQLTKGIAIDRDRAMLFQGINANILKNLSEPSKAPIPDPRIWKAKSIFLSTSLNVESPEDLESLKEDIRSANGIVADSIEEADILITQWREGDDYQTGMKNRIIIGTVEWLRYVETTGVFSSPNDQLLHFPVPRGGVPGFSKHDITITNYTGVARDYLKKMIGLMHARYTATLSQSNTVVVAAHITGLKTAKARDWSIPIVNHLWLEDCFANWSCLPVGQPKYLQYPSGIDWSLVLGKRGIGRVSLGEPEGEAKEVAERLKGRNWIDGPVGADEDAQDGVKVEDERKEDPGDMQVVDETILVDPSVNTTSPKAKAMAAKKLIGQSAVDVLEVDKALSTGVPEDEVDGIKSRRVGSKGKSPKKPDTVPVNSKLQEVQKEDDSDVETTKPSSKPKSKGKRPLVRRSAAHGDEETSRERDNRPSESKARRGMDVDKAEEDEEDDRDNGIRHSKSGSPSKKAAAFKSTPAKATKAALPTHRSEDDSTEETPQPRLKSKQSGKSKVVSDDDDDNLPLGPKKKKRVRDSESEDELSFAPSPPAKKTKLPSPMRKPRRVFSDDESDDDLSTVMFVPKPKKAKETMRETGKERENVPPPKPTASKKTPSSKAVKVIDVDDEDSDVPVIPAEKAAKRRILVDSPSQENAEEQTSRPPMTSKLTGKSMHTAPTKLSKKTNAAAIGSPLTAPSKNLGKNRELGHEADSEVEEIQRHVSKSEKRRASEAANAESQVPSVDDFGVATRSPSRRSAAAKAGEKLRDSVKDMNTFQEQMKRGKVRGSWENDKEARAGPNVNTDSSEDGEERAIHTTNTKKRKTTVADHKAPSVSKKKKLTDEDETNERRSKPISKSGRESTRDARRIKILATQVSISDAETKELKKLGANMITDPTKCTHLVVQKLCRTEKFLCAIAAAPFIVTEGWVKACVKAGEAVDESKYLLQDAAGEAKWGFRLSEALQRAKANGGKLLKGHSFYVTKKTAIDLNLLNNIIVAHGGECVIQNITYRLISGHPNRHVISDLKDKEQWAALAKDGVPIYTPELVITGVLLQKLDWKKNLLS